ncbi:MAG: hypothetical protein J6S76_07635, partial [Clostridia bacterium]|nr:hypothetical protein [Clostridia bacterium]
MRIKRRLIALGLVLGMLAMGACDGPESTDTENTTGAETMEPAVFDESNPVIYLSADAVAGNGMKKTPFGDVKEALDCAKALAADGAKHITLNFDGGNYSVTEELQITGADFGSTTLEFICEDEEMAVIGAWLPVTGFTETQVNGVTAWVAPMPKINGETIYSHQFFTQEKERLTLPCYPEDGSMLYTEYMAG